jgi:hypothetical protein
MGLYALVVTLPTNTTTATTNSSTSSRGSGSGGVFKPKAENKLVFSGDYVVCEAHPEVVFWYGHHHGLG